MIDALPDAMCDDVINYVMDALRSDSPNEKVLALRIDLLATRLRHYEYYYDEGHSHKYAQ